jgi:hypothetical protein
MRRELMQLAQAYCRATGYKLATVANYAKKDPRIFNTLQQQMSGTRKGSFNVDTYDDLVAWLRDPANWPEKVRIGEDVDGEPIYRPFRLSDIPELGDLTHHKRKR